MEYSFYVKDMEDCITVVDVYDSAALIGKDFEYLIEQYGVEAVTDLMPKVIRVLEQLEYLAAQSEKENENIVQLEATIRRLNSDKEERNRERQRYEQDLEQIEESYRKESKDLLALVSNLQEQNRRLQDRLQENSSGQKAAVEKGEQDLSVIESLRDTVSKQRNQIKGLQRDVKQKECDVDAIQQHADRLARDNAALRLSSSKSQTQADRLREDQVALQNTLHAKDVQIMNIRARMVDDHRKRNDSMQAHVTQMANAARDMKMMAHIKTMQAKHLIDEKSELQSQLQDREQRIRLLTAETKGEADEANLIGQMVGDVRDPDNPRFTLNELREVLMERNTLKSQLIEVEEELSYYKQRDQPEKADIMTGSVDPSSPVLDDEANYVGPVQGPINREPWEKLEGKKESGIRKFFERFPVELPETIRVNIVPGELASYAQAKASSFWDLRRSPSKSPGEGRPRSEYIPTPSDI